MSIKSNRAEALKQKLSALYVLVGTKILTFSRKHPYIFSQIVVYSLGLIATLIATLVER